MQYTQALNTMKTHKPGTPEHTEAWKHAEQAKNLNGGMPPLAGHTPGPWVADDWAPGWSISAPSAGYTVCQLVDCDNAGPNARLIAAAPELLAALENVVAVVGEHKGTPESFRQLCNEFNEARAAIAKAKQ